MGLHAKYLKLRMRFSILNASLSCLLLFIHVTLLLHRGYFYRPIHTSTHVWCDDSGASHYLCFFFYFIGITQSAFY